MIAVLAVAASVLPGGHAVHHHNPCASHSCRERVARKLCSQTRPRWCVERAILTYRLRPWQAAWMRRVSRCESGGNPLAYYPGRVARTASVRAWVEAHNISAGLFAFKSSTFRGTRYGRRGRSAFSAKWASLGAAEVLRARGPSDWACK